MRIAINGFGRIGRLVFKIAMQKGIQVVAINDLTDIKNLVYLLKYDSVYGPYNKVVEAGKDFIKVNGKKIIVFCEKNPKKLPWKELNIDYVVESTGIFRDYDKAALHLKAGAKRVLISAPSKDPDITVVYGVNHREIRKYHKIISVASCTTNCLAPVAKVLSQRFGILRGFMTTVHGYTSSQNIVDGPHKKVRRGRAGAINIVPTTSGATIATAKVLPELKGRLDGLAMRIPLAVGSIVDFVVELSERVSVEEVNDALKKAALGPLKGILYYSEDELVSSDIIGNSHSSIVDGLSTQVLGNMIKILLWYDNEYGYSCRMVDIMRYLG
ncbi:MAG: type I glyceraldehyde-3-phosphate dehydrogenase [archaeon]